MSGDSTFTYLDAYCERAGDTHLWGEPLNAVTNLAFIAAALVACGVWRSYAHLTLRNSWDILLLMVTLAIIGVGSGLWHLVPSGRTLLMDVIPIVVFMNIYLLSAAVRLLRLRWFGAIGLLAVFHALNYASEAFLPRDVLNGSIMYIPAFIMLGVIYAGLAKKGDEARHLVSRATLLFLLSLTFRTIDMDICGLFPLGTHFLWHVLNACVLYLLLQALIRKKPVPAIT